jgi:hypothetical protein
MGKKAAATVAGLVVAASFIPAAAFGRTPDTEQQTCAPVPVSIDNKDIHVGSQTVHVGSRSQIKVCVTTDVRAEATPTITFFKNCGDACFAVRMARVDVYENLKVELSWREDGVNQAITVDPEPLDASKEVGDICVSNHSEGTPDPCLVTLVSPSNLTARGGRGRINLSWTPASEAYGRTAGLQYEIWMSETGEPDTFSLLGTSATTQFTDQALARGTHRWYFVVAFDADGNRSGGSNVGTAIAK